MLVVALTAATRDLTRTTEQEIFAVLLIDADSFLIRATAQLTLVTDDMLADLALILLTLHVIAVLEVTLAVTTLVRTSKQEIEVTDEIETLLVRTLTSVHEILVLLLIAPATALVSVTATVMLVMLEMLA